MQKNLTPHIDHFDLIVVGAGASGMMAAIIASRAGKKVLLLEKLSSIGAKLRATGGGRCNITNTLSNEDFMECFGREGRFMSYALEAFDHHALITFFASISVQCHAPDGQRVFPLTHDASTVILSLEEEMKRLGVMVLCSQKVEKLDQKEGHIIGVTTSSQSFKAFHVILATGGLGYPQLGAEGDGFALTSALGHTITELYPAMIPLYTKEHWVKNCRADTIPKVKLRIDLPKAKKLRAQGDLIFTSKGIRGPVVLDFAREITPLLEKHGEVPILANLTKGLDEDQIRQHLKNEILKNRDLSILLHVSTLLPQPVAKELCLLINVDPDTHFGKLSGLQKDKLVQLLAWTPLTIIGHEGFKSAMITRGGISLKEIDPKTLESKLIRGLFFCGEVVNLDGPCGGFNLQWSFSSGYLAGYLGEVV